MDSKSVWKTSLIESAQTLSKFVDQQGTLEKCTAFSDLLVRTYLQGGTAFICGNGGSHCDALHFAEELTGKYRKERRPLAAMALGEATHVTCVGNDYGFAEIFSRGLQAFGKKGDLLIALSTRGNSEHVIRAVSVAKSTGISTVGLLGRDGGKLRELVDLALIVPATTSDRIQEVHMTVLHTVIEVVERQLFPENY